MKHYKINQVGNEYVLYVRRSKMNAVEEMYRSVVAVELEKEA